MAADTRKRFSAELQAQSWMSLADFDRDGKLDLLVTGQDHNPNYQIVLGGTGFTAGALVVLPDGPFGHNTRGGYPPDGALTTAEVSPVAVADFNNDGLPDIFAVIRNETWSANGNSVRGDSTYQIRLNQGSSHRLSSRLNGPKPSSMSHSADAQCRRRAMRWGSISTRSSRTDRSGPGRTSPTARRWARQASCS